MEFDKWSLPPGLTLQTITTTSGTPPTTMTLGQISGTACARHFDIHRRSAGFGDSHAVRDANAEPHHQCASAADNHDANIAGTGTTASPYSEAIQSKWRSISRNVEHRCRAFASGLDPQFRLRGDFRAAEPRWFFDIHRQATDSETPPETATMTYTVSVVANSNIVANNLLVAGPFAFLFRGFGKAAASPEFPEILIGTFRPTEKEPSAPALLTRIRTASSRTSRSPAAYSMGSDGRGSMTWSIPGPGSTILTLSFQMALDAESNLIFTEQDNSGNRGTGIIRQQSTTTFTAGVFSGDYSFLFPDMIRRT